MRKTDKVSNFISKNDMTHMTLTDLMITLREAGFTYREIENWAMGGN